MKIRCIAVDDEPPALAQMEDYINRVPYLHLLKSFDNGIDAIEYLKENEVDLLFLDIHMEGLTGIQLLKILKNRPKVILTTAYDGYALQAFDLDVVDYLLKPISFERFYKSVEKICDLCNSKSAQNQPSTMPVSDEKSYMFVKTEYRMQRVDFEDILYVEGLKEYLIIKMRTGQIITLQSFKQMEDLLPDSNFIRVHKSYMVALDKIDFIERNRIRIGEKLIPIGDTYRKTFFETLGREI